MSQNETTALAPQQAQPLAKKSLLRELANAAGLDEMKYYGTIKSLCGCDRATDEHFAALMMVAQGLQLNPILRELYLMPTQRGVQVVVPIDGYLSFLQRAETAGLIEWHEYHEDWYPDMRVAPEKRGTRRGGRVTAKKRGRERIVEHTEWFDEVYRDTSVWKQGQSRQLMHKTYRQFCRYHLGFSPMDVDDAERMNENEPRRVDAEVSDSPPIKPVVPIVGLTRALPPAPVSLETEAQGKPTSDAEAPRQEPSPTAVSDGQAPASPATSPEPDEFDREESLKVDRALAEASVQPPKDGGLFRE